jgi:segregation and condensation protein A
MEPSAPPGDAQWTVHTDVFDGPLDLLLYLVKRDGIDLKRLPVARIADSYLAFLEQMREVNLSIAGDWLVMAATLVHLKSLELLPRLPTALEEEEDPREVLVRQLEEHQRFREAASALDHRSMIGRDVFTREPLALETGREGPFVAGIDAFALFELFHGLLGRAPKEPPPFAPERQAIGFGEICRRVVDALLAGGELEIGSWLRALATRAERVVGFVAILEMIRQEWVDVAQEVHLGAALVRARVDLASVDLGRVAGWVEATS